MTRRILLKLAIAALLLSLAAVVPVRAGDGWSYGTASEYGPGHGAAIQSCTWTLRHTAGCGLLRIQSLDTGLVVVVPIVDWCQCYRGTPAARIVDLEYSVVDALGLDRSAGLYRVRTQPIHEPAAAQAVIPAPVHPLPNTAMSPPR